MRGVAALKNSTRTQWIKIERKRNTRKCLVVIKVQHIEPNGVCRSVGFSLLGYISFSFLFFLPFFGNQTEFIMYSTSNLHESVRLFTSFENQQKFLPKKIQESLHVEHWVTDYLSSLTNVSYIFRRKFVPCLYSRCVFIDY